MWAGNAIMTGDTNSLNMATANALARRPSADKLIFSTFLGGKENEYGHGLSLRR